MNKPRRINPISTVPSVSSFSPTSGPASTSVTVSGANFTGVTSVTFNGSSASHSVDSGTQITATVPGGATTGRVGVVGPGGSCTSLTDFTVS